MKVKEQFPIGGSDQRSDLRTQVLAKLELNSVRLNFKRPFLRSQKYPILTMGFRAGLVVSITSFLLGKYHKITL